MAGPNEQLHLEEAEEALEEIVGQVKNREDHAWMLFLWRSRYSDGMLEFIQLTKALHGTRSSLLDLQQAAAETFLLHATFQACARDRIGETAICCVCQVDTAAMIVLCRLWLLL